MVQQQPGDRILGGILSGQVDLFSLAPALPHESPLPFVPRYLARQMWPQGFQPFQQPVPALALAPVQPAPAVVAQPIQPPANQVRPPARPRVAAQPTPRKRVLERGTFPEWH